MKNYFLRVLILGLLFSACNNDGDGIHSQKGEPKLMIAVAANVQYVMKELEATFEQQYNIKIETNISSSGKLTAQIQQGAPFDLFLSANMKYPQTLFESGYATEPPKVYAYGTLVLWTMKAFDLTSDEAILRAGNFDKLAIANPKNAPYGEQAIRVFENYQLLEQIEPKLVYGESIAQTNQYIVSKACDLGVTAKSVVLSPELKDKGQWVEVSPDAYSPIQQGVVITKYGQEHHPEACKAFFDFIFSSEAKEIFERYGYKI